jgi:hypothetical protein
VGCRHNRHQAEASSAAAAAAPDRGGDGRARVDATRSEPVTGAASNKRTQAAAGFTDRPPAQRPRLAQPCALALISVAPASVAPDEDDEDHRDRQQLGDAVATEADANTGLQPQQQPDVEKEEIPFGPQSVESVPPDGPVPQSMQP